MEVHQKRKYSHNGEIEVKKQIKTEKNDGKSKETAVEDDEVEEFYAILRRIRVAVKYFEKEKSEGENNNNRLSIMSQMESGEDRAAQSLNSALRAEDFKRVVEGVKEDEKVEDNAGLDLNADPDTDTNSESD